MPSFSFILTEKCNWNCPYCYFSKLEYPKEPMMLRYQKHLPYIKKIIDKLGDLVVNIDIQGGEVGLVPEDIMEYFFETIDRPIAVSTNGMFIEKGYHENPKIKPHIANIMYHVTENFDRPPQFNIGSMGIVHDDIETMVRYIKDNPNIMFDYVEFEFDINEHREMDIDMYQELYEKIENLNNISDNAKNIINQRRLYENPNHRDNCKKYNHSILIDLVNANICLCQRQLDINIPLTEENLIYRLKTFPKDIFKDDHCESCTRLYYGKFQGNVIERALLTRSRL
jgi:organic radical activating enzyme